MRSLPTVERRTPNRVKQLYWRWRTQAIEAVSRIGEATGQEWLTYHPLAYESFWESAREAAPGFASILRELFPDVQSAIDVGCGTGNYVAALRAVGINTNGYEYSARARRIAARRLGLMLHPLDLAEHPSFPRVDLALSLEVAEHLPPALGDRLVTALALAAPLVLFSAAARGQGGIGHVNEQPRAYWLDRFSRVGYAYDARTTAAIAEACQRAVHGAPWIAANICLFRV